MRSRLLLVFGLGLATIAGCCTPSGTRSLYVGRPLAPAPCTNCPPSQPPLVAAAPAAPPTTNISPVTPATAFAPPVSGDPPFSRFNADNGSRLYPPLPTTPAPMDPPAARLLPPQSLPVPQQPEGPPVVAKEPIVPKDPVVPKETQEPPILPADIPQFAFVSKGIASGQKPFPDGVKWLKDHGFKSVLYVRAPTETDNATKRIFESRGLNYIDLEVSPQTLTKDVVDRFNQVLADENNRPLFVFDKNSALAGALWYIHFRTVDGMTDEKARAEAMRLGFKQDQDDAQRDMWIAVQNYLSKLNP